MNSFSKYSLYNAPQDSLAQLEVASRSFGNLPNLLGYMAGSPALLNSYVYLSEQAGSMDLTPTERQVVLMTVNRFHECRYCMAGHSQYAETQGIDMEVINAIRDDLPIGNPKLAALRSFALKLAEQRGVVSQTLINAFFDAGYNQQNALEVIALITLKVMSNYTNHLVGTEMDGASIAKRWSPISER
ncbi:alkylhydroperoxidase AhpD family core domain-containing protein [Ferrimonas sediminum]|uniref:Alkylhydroperoxidase AhpD family core domain-containing protein n=1 Tax=Ferrimonas sediminum TaxID=718193 RepID=A0A1G8RJR1_9GAMM|nr:carboxymuconolactone decarboxylase family protein [Ferrimonas sediminum]SDJ17237.1 alkylhydroperoxidase AhpD family core domain-containing protein [Ferrimonas sediminum]